MLSLTPLLTASGIMEQVFVYRISWEMHVSHYRATNEAIADRKLQVTAMFQALITSCNFGSETFRKTSPCDRTMCGNLSSFTTFTLSSLMFMY